MVREALRVILPRFAIGKNHHTILLWLEQKYKIDAVIPFYYAIQGEI